MPAMEDRISIIIPVYNVRPYLDRCMESVTGQTHRNIEVILVDDGSTDGSGAVCDAWAARDSRVRCLHQANAGVSAARNHGFESSTGDYILFVDGDDRLAPDMCETMWKTMTEAGADIGFCGYRESYPDHTLERRPDPVGTMTARAMLKAVFSDTSCMSIVCNKLFRRRVLLDGEGRMIPFPGGIFVGEDQLWLVRVLSAAQDSTVAVCPECLYDWMRRAGSATDGGSWTITSKRLTVLESDRSCIREIQDQAARAAAWERYEMDLFGFLTQAYQDGNGPMKQQLWEAYRASRRDGRKMGIPQSWPRIKWRLGVCLLRLGLSPDGIDGLRRGKKWAKGIGRGGKTT